jgi:asparagine synthase (glutamine-hydrolysing)
MFRYFALIWKSDDAQLTAATETISSRLKTRSNQWHVALDRPGLLVLCADTRSGVHACRLLANVGIVVGAVFHKQSALSDETPCVVENLTEAESAAIAASHGRRLIQNYWGDYVAFIDEPSSTARWIVKDPAGELPCMHAHCRGIDIFFSCLTDFLGLGLLPLTVNWDYVHGLVAGSAFDVRRSSVREVSRVQRGEAVRIAADSPATSPQRLMYWNPLTFSDSSNAIRDAEIAAKLLRETVRGCVAAYAHKQSNLLVRLSGGLDSSIVLSCITSAPERKVISYTYFNPSGKSDERRWAHLAAAQTSTLHVERTVHPASIDLEPMLKVSPSLEPTSAMMYIARGPVERQLAAEHGCNILFSGDGGDAVLGAESVNLAADDYLRLNGIRPGLRSVAEQVASFRDGTVWTVLRRALRRWMLGSNMHDYAHSLSGSRTLLAPQLANPLLQLKRYPHPWFNHQSSVSWETIRRLGILLLHPQFFYDPFLNPGQANPQHIAPLYAQPVVELCLRIPIYLHFLDGAERGLARRAFRRDVPAPILQRQWKDRAPESSQALKLRNLPFIRSMLLDGLLSQEKLLNRVAVESVLATNAVTDGASMVELFRLLDIEIWLRTLLDNVRYAQAA